MIRIWPPRTATVTAISNIEKYIDGIDPTKKIDWKDPKNNVNTLEKAQIGERRPLRP